MDDPRSPGLAGAALSFVDRFLPGDDLPSLEELRPSSPGSRET